jgi:hypothetical protein
MVLGKNATAFGQGVYFAKNSEYSHQYTDKRKNKPTAHMFVSKVLVGKTTMGNYMLEVISDLEK